MKTRARKKTDATSDEEKKRLQRASTEELVSTAEPGGENKTAKLKSNASDSVFTDVGKTVHKSSTAETLDIDELIAEDKVAPSKSTTKRIKSASGQAKRKRSVETKPTKRAKADVANGSTAAANDDCQGWLRELLPDNDWKELILDLFDEDYSKSIESLLSQEALDGEEVFPPRDLIFNAFTLTPLSQVNVVILGQDPYHDVGQAHGLAFSVPHGIPTPPSLKNVYKELLVDIPDFKTPDHGCLESWAKQGVLMINAALTVRAHVANSHSRCGWHKFTDDVLTRLSNHSEGLVFILWGGFAHKKAKLLDDKKHTIICSAHPSSLSFGKFYGCKCFSKANKALETYGKSAIDWRLV